MRRTRSQSDSEAAKTAHDLSRSRRSFEWPLLIYPVLFLATLGLLYLVNRSMEKERCAPVRPPRAGQEQTVTPDRAAGAALHSAKSLPSVGARENEVLPSPDGAPSDVAGQPSSIVGKRQRAVDLSHLKGAARTVALLRIAVDKNDRTKIKQCMAELVALGEEAIGPLSRLMAEEQNDTALAAAAVLARIGTPLATGALLDRLGQTNRGVYKEDLCKRVASINNHDSWPLLLAAIVESTDSTVVRAAGTSLAAMADAPIIDEVMARYDAAATEAEAQRLVQMVRNVRSPKATGSLLSLAGDPAIPPQDSLQEAALSALAKVGDGPSVSYLLRRLEACPPGQDTQVFNTITRIDSPDAQASLLYAAAGNKEVSAGHGQTAAILALKNYPNEQTVALLERLIAQEQNEKVLTAATRTLDAIKQSPQAVAAKADDRQRSEQMLPLKTLEK